MSTKPYEKALDLLDSKSFLSYNIINCMTKSENKQKCDSDKRVPNLKMLKFYQLYNKKIHLILIFNLFIYVLYLHACILSRLSHVRLFADPKTIARQAALSSKNTDWIAISFSYILCHYINVYKLRCIKEIPKESSEELTAHYLVLWFIFLGSSLFPYLPAILLLFFFTFSSYMQLLHSIAQMIFWKLLSITVLKVFLFIGR